MRKTVLALTIRNKITNQLVDIQIIHDQYTWIDIRYEKPGITEEDIKKVKNIDHKYYLDFFKENGYIAIQGEAKDIPSIGNGVVAIESKEIDWE